MTNTELIATLRWCGGEVELHEMCVDESYRCPMWNEDRMTDYCKADLMLTAADAIERLVADRNKLKDKLILNICSHCDSRFDYCGECPIIKDINEAFDEQ